MFKENINLTFNFLHHMIFFYNFVEVLNDIFKIYAKTCL